MDLGQALPMRPQDYAGVCLLGGEMSVNDQLPWMAPLYAWLHQADQVGLPIIGHCLGGQLLARAWGAEVRRNPVKEIGWRQVQAVETSIARDWLGPIREFDTFQWHGDTFDWPPGAEPLLTNRYCAQQAYVLQGRHLGMQCHVEMTSALVTQWCAEGSEEIAEEFRRTGGPATQTPAQMLQGLEQKTNALNAVARQLYDRWARGLIQN